MPRPRWLVSEAFRPRTTWTAGFSSPRSPAGDRRRAPGRRGPPFPAGDVLIQPEPRRTFVTSHTDEGPHRIACLEWGPDAADRTAVCVHGLTGCARDFDALASVLAGRGWRVVCVDLPGRGDSDWLADAAHYELRQYVSDLGSLLHGLRTEAVSWIGTSLGGLVGMALAAAPGGRIERLVLNDIGPFVPTAALQRLDTHVGHDPRFPDVAEAEAYLRRTREPFGRLTDDQWRTMAERSTRPDGDGGYRLHYDPAIAVRFHEAAGRDIDLWDLWDEIRCPVLVLRGERSDLLLAGTAEEMTARGPGAELLELEGCGHNPPLLDRAQIDPVAEWLERQ